MMNKSNKVLYVNICKYLYLWIISLKIHIHRLRLRTIGQKPKGAYIHRYLQAFFTKEFDKNRLLNKMIFSKFYTGQTESMRYNEIMIFETIKKQIKTSGKSRYQIAKESGVSESQLFKILQRKGCNIKTADKLLKYFGLEIKPIKKGR